MLVGLSCDLFIEINMNITRLKRELKKAEPSQRKEIEQRVQDYIVAKELMIEHYDSHLEPKIPFWG